MRLIILLKRLTRLATAALLAMLILVPGALAQGVELPGDADVLAPEPNAVVVDEETLQQIAGQPLPGEPAREPVSVQPSTGAPLPGTGGPEIGSILALVLSVSVVFFLSGLAILARLISRRR